MVSPLLIFLLLFGHIFNVCRVRGNWSEWNAWSSCSVTCGIGRKSRSKNYNNTTQISTIKTSTAVQTTFCLTTRCAVDGRWGSWDSWSSCSVSCGGGTRSRPRSCTNPTPANGGKACSGVSSNLESCNTQSCPVDGGWASWSSWSLCSVSCGGGTRSRPRSCTNPTPANGVKACSGVGSNLESCNTQSCPVDGGWASWSSWSLCSVSCGGGTRSRPRSCTNPTPANGGKACSDVGSDFESCNTQSCPVDGGWTSWSSWSLCSVSCGGGTRSRSRSCANPTPANDGNLCSGSSSNSGSCNTSPCPVDGGWTSWSSWSSCPVSCGDGTRSRSRSCSNPTPANGGRTCSGSSSDSGSCNTLPCPVDGGWTSWSSWSSCPVTCGGGTSSRSRSCTNPKPANGGNSCSSSDSDSGSCNRSPCPVDGGWSNWNSWTSCPVSCDGGTRSRSRSCANPTPANGGRTCSGSSSNSGSCNTSPCPVDGGWTSWSLWSSCPVSCGGGTRSRSRSCSNPTPANGGKACSGSSFYSGSCNSSPCPVDGGWTSWGLWSLCSVSCGGGTRTRSRSCTNPTSANGGKSCSGSSFDTGNCNTSSCPVDGGWASWSSWSSCPVTCGGGTRTRSRSCTNPTPANGGRTCSGSSSNSGSCNTSPCPVDGGWTSWCSWSSCPVTCGGGTRNRSRSCINPTPAYDGLDCHDLSFESETCNTHLCQVNGLWGTWKAWSLCSNTCGLGTKTRSRSCDNPKPRNGGEMCAGFHSESKGCLSQPCPVNGGWSIWSQWSRCTVSCGSGSRAKTRTCTNPEPENGGLECLGNSTDALKCSSEECQDSVAQAVALVSGPLGFLIGVIAAVICVLRIARHQKTTEKTEDYNIETLDEVLDTACYQNNQTNSEEIYVDTSTEYFETSMNETPTYSNFLYDDYTPLDNTVTNSNGDYMSPDNTVNNTNKDYMSLDNTVNNPNGDYVSLDNTVNNPNGDYVSLDNTVNNPNRDNVPLDYTDDNPDGDYMSLDNINRAVLDNEDYTQLNVQDTKQTGERIEMGDYEVPISCMRNDNVKVKEDEHTVCTLNEDLVLYNNCISNIEKKTCVCK